MAVDFLGALGAGSDIDTKSLVESLVDAERVPKELLINRKVSKSETEISAYGIVMASLESLDVAFQKLNDAKDFVDYMVNVTGGETIGGGASFSVTASAADTELGNTSIEVDALATADRWASTQGFDAETTEINNGVAFTLTFTDSDGNDLPVIAVSDTTPEGVVNAINGSDLGFTVEAQLVDTGAENGRYRIVLAGDLGVENGFSVTTTATDGNNLDFNTRLETASDAEIQVNGLAVIRSSNTITDVVDGITLNLLGESVATGSITVTRSTDGVKENIQELVDVYNAVYDQFDKLSDPDSEEDMGGSLSSDSLFDTIFRRVKSFFSDPSTTPGENVSYLSEIGVAFNRYGKLEIDEDRLDVSLVDHFDDIVTMLSADTDNQSNIGDAARGIAGDAINTLATLMASDGPVLSRTNNLEARVADYAEDLQDLDRKMDQIYARYLAQFTVMEQAIDQMNSTREYLTTALQGLPFTNKD